MTGTKRTMTMTLMATMRTTRTMMTTIKMTMTTAKTLKLTTDDHSNNDNEDGDCNDETNGESLPTSEKGNRKKEFDRAILVHKYKMMDRLRTPEKNPGWARRAK